MDLILIRKKSGNLEEWNSQKIIRAIHKSADRAGETLSEEEDNKVVNLVLEQVYEYSSNVIPVNSIHSFVENALESVNHNVALSYKGYRDQKKMWANSLEEIYKKVNSLLFIGDKDNANADSKLASTIGCLMAGYTGTHMYEEIFLTPAERKAMADGFIYVHDRDKRYYYSLNCCLFNAWKLLENGFEMSNVWYNTPKTIGVAFHVIADIVLMAASQQYGGFTLYRVDEHLSPYAEKSYKRYLELFEGCKDREKKAEEQVIQEIRQGYQCWEYKFNTVASSRGDYPFITITLGLAKDKWGKLIAKTILDGHKNGQGKEGFKKATLFPKIVFLYDENLHGAGKELENVYQAAIDCSAKAAYPDYLSLTGNGYVPSMYKQYGEVVSPMGCRAFLSPWYERGGMHPADENDRPVFEGRCNIGAVSLNLPLIYQWAVSNDADFYETLDIYLEMIRNIHKRTYEAISQMPATRAPLHWCEGGLYGGNCKYDEKIGKERLKPMTASFGVTALNELQECYNRKSLVEDGEFAYKVMEYINSEVNRFKEEDGWLYAIYGTPAEKLCSVQVDKFRQMFGIIEGVSDREYVSNSFHCHVSEQISPIEKQDLEERFWNQFNGGKIQYCRYPLGYNKQAIRSLVDRAMDKGFYEGVNLSICYCNTCGYQTVDVNDDCPACGSKDLTKIDRMNGYLAYSRVRGDTRLNKGKMAEIKDRISM